MTNQPASNPAPLEVVGLSISGCILALAEGKIPQNLVQKLIGGTGFEDFESMWGEYSQKYWTGNMLRARSVFFALVEQKRIDQPRLRGEEPPDPSAGIWRIGYRQFDTPGAQELVSASDALLKMSPADRNELIETMPPEVVSALRNAIAVGRLKPLIPDFQEATANSTEPEIAQRVRERLKAFFQTAPACEPREAYPEVLFHLQAWVRSRGTDKPKAPPRDARPAKYSQYRPAIKLPDGGTTG